MAIILELTVVPSSGKQALIHMGDKGLRCYLKSAAEKGKANQELITFVAKILKMPRMYIAIKSGLTQRKKRLHIETEKSYDEVLRAFGIVLPIEKQMTWLL